MVRVEGANSPCITDQAYVLPTKQATSGGACVPVVNEYEARVGCACLFDTVDRGCAVPILVRLPAQKCATQVALVLIMCAYSTAGSHSPVNRKSQRTVPVAIAVARPSAKVAEHLHCGPSVRIVRRVPDGRRDTVLRQEGRGRRIFFYQLSFARILGSLTSSRPTPSLRAKPRPRNKLPDLVALNALDTLVGASFALSYVVRC